MQYIVLDLEWNQALSAQDPVYQKLPFHLTGEIIQIGAVRVDQSGVQKDEFKLEIRPIWFKKLHSTIKKLTGLNERQLAKGLSFPEAISRFRNWCGEDCVFLTWGFDDIRMLKQNLMLYGMGSGWLEKWYNLQVIYNAQTDGSSNQKALKTAADEMGISQNRPAHDALNDAYYTACIACRLDLKRGMAEYPAPKKSSVKKAGHQQEGEPFLLKELFENYRTKSQAQRDRKQLQITCPQCEEWMASDPVVSQNGEKRIFLARCPEHGSYFVRLKVEKERKPKIGWRVVRTVFEADEEKKSFYRSKYKSHLQRKKHGITANVPKKENDRTE